MFFVLTTPNYWSNYDNYSTFASFSFTTDYADFTDYFLQMDLPLHRFFLILQIRKPCRALKNFSSAKPNLYNSFRNPAEQAAKSV